MLFRNQTYRYRDDSDSMSSSSSSSSDSSDSSSDDDNDNESDDERNDPKEEQDEEVQEMMIKPEDDGKGEEGRMEERRERDDLTEEWRVRTIEKAIQLRKRFLNVKRDQMQRVSKENEFLKLVERDYDVYNQFMIQEKEKQIQALQTVYDYLQQLNDTGEANRAAQEHLEQEQRRMVNKMNQIRYKMHKWMNYKNKNRTGM